MGAGVIPFSVQDRKVYFLFQTTFSGRTTGHLIDFGGGVNADENARSCAIREFIEETETMYFSKNVGRARRSAAAVRQQIPIVEALFEETLALHPDWWCRRAPGNPLKPKRWKTFFVEFPYRDVETLNREWKADEAGRFKKRRELFWVETNALLSIYENAPEKLWKRVRQLENATAIIRAIQENKTP